MRFNRFKMTGAAALYLEKRRMKTIVNGAARDVAPGDTLGDLLAELEIDGRGIAVAVNDAVVARSSYAEHTLSEGDRIEVIRAVAGG